MLIFLVFWDPSTIKMKNFAYEMLGQIRVKRVSEKDLSEIFKKVHSTYIIWLHVNVLGTYIRWLHVDVHGTYIRWLHVNVHGS